MATETRVRIAPSPTGEPHVGTAYVALFNRAYARAAGGKFILRIEDTDRERSTRESEEAILRSLRWLGLEWDEGPDVGGPYGPYRQSDRRGLYGQFVEELLGRGGAFRCFCTPDRIEQLRERQRARKQQPRYDGLCRSVDPAEARRRAEAGEPHVVRLEVPPGGPTTFRDEIRREAIAFENAQIDDQVLLKSDGWPTYHLASVVDDHLMGITDVIRAEEWISSTPKHVLLYQAFGWTAPRFFHMPLLRNSDKSKISKRKNPTSLEWYRQQGYLPEALVNFLGLLGWSMSDGREKFSFDEMVADFNWERVGTTGPIFDFHKLDWLNGLYLRALSIPDLRRRLVSERCIESEERLEAIAPVLPLIQERIKKLSEFRPMADFFFQDPRDYEPALLVPKKREASDVRQALARSREVIARADPWTWEKLEADIRALADQLQWKPGDCFMPLRVAVTGSTQSPPLFQSLAVVGREVTLRRIDAALAKLAP
ncbi:MAG: glutamate--tRNA ligase [Planctomycetes bacterium]|nr:glutamate--tRNA ligase [Planctomycetota bacterium]